MSNLLLQSTFNADLSPYFSATTVGISKVSASTSGQYIGVLCTSPGRVYISSNYGSTWTILAVATNQSVPDITFSSSGQYCLITLWSNSIYLSSNYGSTFSLIPAFQSSNLVMYSTINNNGSYIYAVNNINEIFVTTNFGTTWNKIYTFPNSYSYIICDDSGRYVISYNFNLNVIYSRNYGVTWSTLPVVVNDSRGNGAYAMSTNGQYMYTTYSGLTPVYMSSNYGLTWGPCTGKLSKTYTYNNITCNANGSNIYLWATLNSISTLVYSNNYGNSWNFLYTSAEISINGYIKCTSNFLIYTRGTNYYTIDLRLNSNISRIFPKIGSQIFLTQSNFISGGNSPWSTLQSPSAIWSSIACSSDSSIIVGANTYPDEPGYIHLSTNSGNTWTQTSAPKLRWVSITCDSNGSNMYACTNFDGANSYSGTIYGSSSSGTSWTLTSAPKAQYTCVTCDILGVNVYACASDYNYGYLYSSSNYGVSWNVIYRSSQYWSGITCSSNGRNVAACVNGGGVYTSTDNGTNWTQTSIQTSAWCSISCDASGQYLVVADCAPGSIYASSDFGSTWVQSSSPYIQWSGIKSSGDGKYVVASVWNDFIYTSSDYGLSWKQTNSEQRGWSCVTSSYSGYYILAGDNNPGYIYSSTVSMDMSRISGPVPSTKTITTTPLTNFLISPSIKPISIYDVIYPSGNAWAQNFFSICSSRNGQYIYCVAQDLGIVVSTNYGSTWSVLSARPVSGYIWINIACNYSGQYVVASSNYNVSAFYVSSNYATTWIPSNIGAGSDVRLTVTMNNTGSVVIVGGFQIYNNSTGNRQGGFISTNYGSTWRNITSLPQNILGINTNSAACDTTGTYIYSANNNNGIVSVSTNSGSTFTTTLSGSNVYSVACSNTGQYVVTAANSYIYTSSTYGSSWIQRSSAPGGFRVASDSTGQYLAACTNGGNTGVGSVYKSSDYGVTWNIVQNTYSGYTIDNYNSLSITDDNRVIACAYGMNNAKNFTALGTIYSEKSNNTDLLYAFGKLEYTTPQLPSVPSPVYTPITTGLLQGWTNINGSISSTIGNPTPSINVNNGTVCYIDLATYIPGFTSFTNCIFQFDMYLDATSYFLFGCNSNGVGQALFLGYTYFSNHGSGIASTSAWNTVSGTIPLRLNGIPRNTWFNVVLTIDKSNMATWTYNGIPSGQSPYLIQNNGTFIGLSSQWGGAISYVDNLYIIRPQPTALSYDYVSNGLTNYYNFFTTTCYSSNLINVKNIVTSTADISCNSFPLYNAFTSTVSFTNSMLDVSLNTQCMQSNTFINNVQTISIWYRQLDNISGIPIYLFDGSGNESSVSSSGVGVNWTNMYYDGGDSMTPVWTGNDFTYGTWHNITFTSSENKNYIKTFFGKLDGTTGLNIEVASIMVYNRPISQAENLQNYNYMRSTFINSLISISNKVLLTSPYIFVSLNVPSIYSCEMSQNGRYVAGVSSVGSIKTSSDSGRTFNSQIPYDVITIAMSLSGQYIYGGTNGGIIYYSSNYGSSFSSVSVTTILRCPICCNSSGSNVWCVEYTTAKIYQSTNYGVSYTLLYSLDIAARLTSGIIFNPYLNSLYITSRFNGKAYQYSLTTNTVINTWQPNTQYMSPYTNCSGMAISDSGQYVYMVYNAVGVNQLYYSNTYGSTWIGVTIKPESNGFNQGVCCSPTGRYVYTSALGQDIYYSNDYGVTWNSFYVYSLLNNVNLTGITLNTAKNKLIAYSSAGYISTNVRVLDYTKNNLDLSFTNGIPKIDPFGNQIITNGLVFIANDYTRGNVVYMSSVSQSLSTLSGTDTSFTRTFWYKPIVIDGSMNTLSSNNLKMHFRSTPYLSAVFNVVSGTPVTLTSPIVHPKNAWKHYALTYTNTTATLYVDGVSVVSNSSVNYSGEYGNLNAGGLCIGDYNAVGAGGIAYFDKIHNYSTAYSASQISTMYANEFISEPVPFNGLTFSLDLSSSVIPTSDRFGNPLTARGNVSISSIINYGYIMNSPNTNSSLLATYSTPSSFSRCFWYNISSESYGVSIANTVSSTNLPIWFNNTTKLQAVFNAVTGNQVILSDSEDRGSDTWVHYVVTYNGTKATLYVNGSQSTSSNVTYINTGDTSLAVGDYTTSGNGASAKLLNVRCYDRALSSSEVYNMYTYEYAPSYFPYQDTTKLFYSYSVRVVIPGYSGPVFRLRRSTDSATSDFYTDGYQTYLTTGANNTGTSFASWIGAGTAYVTILYDQSGKGNNAIQNTTTSQPTISLRNNMGVSKYVLYFDYQFMVISTPQKILAVLCQYYNTSNYGTILGTDQDYSVRLWTMPTGGTVNYDWYESGGGAKYVYNNGVSVTSLTKNTWNSLASSVTTYPTINIPFNYIVKSYSNDPLAGYMTELNGYNTPMPTTDVDRFYRNRLL